MDIKMRVHSRRVGVCCCSTATKYCRPVTIMLARKLLSSRLTDFPPERHERRTNMIHKSETSTMLTPGDESRERLVSSALYFGDFVFVAQIKRRVNNRARYIYVAGMFELSAASDYISHISAIKINLQNAR